MAVTDNTVEKRPFGLARLERETLHDRAYQEVKKAIMAGAILPGSPMTIRALAKALGTSVMPVREALRRLVAERALELLPNRSVSLPVMTAEKFDEICRIRLALEGLMAETAAQHITADELRRMAKLNEEMVQGKSLGPKRYLAKNQEFHFQIYQAAQMPQAMSIVEALWMQIGPFLNHVVTDVRTTAVFEHHIDALKALQSKNGKAARQAIESDISEAAETIMQLLRDQAASAAE